MIFIHEIWNLKISFALFGFLSLWSKAEHSKWLQEFLSYKYEDNKNESIILYFHFVKLICLVIPWLQICKTSYSALLFFQYEHDNNQWNKIFIIIYLFSFRIDWISIRSRNYIIVALFHINTKSSEMEGWLLNFHLDSLS